jgi:allantoinase
MMKGIHSNNCWIDDRLQKATILFDDRLISAIHLNEKIDAQDIYDAREMVVMPGVIDAHVHVNEPGRAEWEGFDTATQAAAAGGITTIVDMPLNASPVTTTLQALEDKLASTIGKLHVNCGFYGGLVPGNGGAIEQLIDAGVLGIKVFLTHSGVDEFPNCDEGVIERVMPLLAREGIPLLVHCELSNYGDTKRLEQDPTSYAAYVQSRPATMETSAINMMIKLCRKYSCPVHIVHVSAAESLPLIATAKTEGLRLTAETCPHYIYFQAEQVPDAQTIYKCAPPIRHKANNYQLIQSLKSGALDLLASDHSPAPAVIKEIDSGNLLKAWGGIAGLQFLLSASWTALKDNLKIEEFIPLLTAQPARMLSADHHKGFIRKDYDADLVIWSPHETFKVEKESVHHRHKEAPYAGRTLSGVIDTTIVNGATVYHKQSIINKNYGKWLLRK